jgi:preprotein translocase subunit SecY
VLDLFSGGNLRRISIFALGIMPYITASIILQLISLGQRLAEEAAGRG